MVFAVLLFLYVVIIVSSSIVWRSFYKHHSAYHFEGLSEDKLFGFIGHRWLKTLFIVHLMLVALLSTLALFYVW